MEVYFGEAVWLATELVSCRSDEVANHQLLPAWKANERLQFNFASSAIQLG